LIIESCAGDRARPWRYRQDKSFNLSGRSFPVNPADNSQVDVTQKSHSIFAQDQLRLAGDRLQLSAAFRAQFFSLDKPEFTPVARAPYQGIRFDAPPHAYVGDGSLAYFFREAGTKIRTHVGNSYRAPSPFERFGTSFGSFGYSVFGDPRLRPDRSISVDAGVDQALLGNRLRAAATYYYTRLQETTIFDFSGGIDAATDPFGRFGGYRNTGGGLARGLELSLEGRPTPSLDLAIAYTFTNSDQRRPQVEGVVRSLIIPDHQFSVTVTQQLSRRLNVNFDLSLSGRYLAPLFDPGTFVSRAYSFDGIAKADLGFSYRISVSDYRSIYFYGKVDNLFDRKYYESGYRTPGVAGVAGMRFEF
jgi:iron complex outermembrane receptor protein